MFDDRQLRVLKLIDRTIYDKYHQEHSGHDYWHIKRVVNLTQYIMPESADPYVAVLIAYLHEEFDDKLHDSTAEEPIVLRQVSDQFAEVKDLVYDGIKQIGYKGGFNTPQRFAESQVVSDADVLDAMGALGIGRAFYYAGARSIPFFDPDLEGILPENLEEYRNLPRNSVTHFAEKLLKLKDTIVTEKAKPIAEKRHQILLDFYESFYHELQQAKILGQ